MLTVRFGWVFTTRNGSDVGHWYGCLSGEISVFQMTGSCAKQQKAKVEAWESGNLTFLEAKVEDDASLIDYIMLIALFRPVTLPIQKSLTWQQNTLEWPN